MKIISLFCSSNHPKPKDNHFIIMYDKEKQNHHILEAETSKYLAFFDLKMSKTIT